MSYPTIYIRGMMEIDDKFEAMIALRNACDTATVPYPQEIIDYFGRDPDESDYELEVGKFGVGILAFDGSSGNILAHATNLDMVKIPPTDLDMTRIYDIDLENLPQALKALRIEINW